MMAAHLTEPGMAPQGPVAALVLAAGRSRRMGQPKPLLPWDGQPAVLRIAALLAPCRPRVLVVRPDADWLDAPALAGQLDQAYRVVVNPEPDRGMLSSLQCGLAALAESRAAVLMTPVDCLGWSGATVAALLDRLSPAASALIPTWQGVAGHPVLLAPAAIRAVLATDPTRTSLRDLLADLTPPSLAVAVDDPAVLCNLNTPEQLPGRTRTGGA